MSVVQSSQATWEKTKIAGIESKGLFELPEGTGKLVLLEPGAAYPEHQHPDRTEYAFVLEGTPVLTVGATDHHCQVGDFVTFPVNERHALSNPSEQRAVLFVGALVQQTTEAELAKQRARQENLKGFIREVMNEELQGFYQKVEDLIKADRK